MQITFDHTDLANPACRRILAALLDRDKPQQLALDLEPAAPTLTDPPVPTAPAPTAPDGTDASTEPPHPVFDLDADGAVWDARLHSSSRTKTADGRWKKRRGSADLPPPAPAATMAPSPAATMAPAEPVIPWGDAPAAPPAPAPTVPPVPAAPAAPVDASAFPAFMQHVAKLQAAKMLPMVTLLEIIKRHGFATLIELSKQPEAIPAVMADLPSLPEAQL